MANDSSLLPTPETAPPSSANQSTVGPNPFNYSDHLSRLITSLDQISISLAFTADKMDNISDKMSNISNKMDIISEKISSLENLAKDVGIKTVDPYTIITVASLYSYYTKNPTETGEILTTLKDLPQSVKDDLNALADLVKDLPKLP